MAGEVAGQDFLLHVSTDGTTYSLIGACTAHSFSVSNEPVDITNKDSVWQVLLDGKGKKSVSFDVSGFISSDTDYTTLETRAFSATASLIFCRMIIGNGKKVDGSFHLSNFNAEGADKQGVTFSATFTSSGAVTIGAVS